MVYHNKIACVFGGTGFIGRQVVKRLCDEGYIVKIASRIPERANLLKTCGRPGQIVPVFCDYSDPKSLLQCAQHCNLAVNMIGILYERKKGQFHRVHTELAGDIAKACQKADVESFVHISALGVDKAGSCYAQSKLAGEKAVFKSFRQAAILRPSIVFGKDDNFFNMFAKLAGVLPFLPLIGGGKTLFQPVYVGDVADAVVCCAHNDETQGHIYELGGSEVKSFEALLRLMLHYTEQKSRFINLPFFIAKIDAFFLQFFPKPLLTPDQVESLKTDNIVSDKALNLANLGITPMSMEAILPTYLPLYRTGGRFAHHNE